MRGGWWRLGLGGVLVGVGWRAGVGGVWGWGGVGGDGGGYVDHWPPTVRNERTFPIPPFNPWCDETGSDILKIAAHINDSKAEECLKSSAISGRAV